jgi:hypothetical protein
MTCLREQPLMGMEQQQKMGKLKKLLRKISSAATSYIMNLTWYQPEFSPRLCTEKPSFNHPGYGRPHN